MTRKKCSNGGFTLVELLVVILTGSVITLAATTILLLGLRVNHQSGEMLTRQNTTRILLSALEDVIAEGTVTDIDAGPAAWEIKGTDDKVLFSYDSEEQAIRTGDAVLIKDVIASHIAWDDTGKLITISVETEDGSYTVSTYCRTGKLGDPDDKNDDGLIEKILDLNNPAPFDTLDPTRLDFLQTLAGQYKMNGGVNPGLILDKSGNSTGKSYVQWYAERYKEEWPPDTAWCACYISWALVEMGKSAKEDWTKNGAPSWWNHDNWFATVEYFKAYIQDTSDEGWKRAGEEPKIGDLIFFDWDGDGKPQHVGVVLDVSGDYVYTIEGNSANRVAVRRYELGDEQIDGYGDFDCLF